MTREVCRKIRRHSLAAYLTEAKQFIAIYFLWCEMSLLDALSSFFGLVPIARKQNFASEAPSSLSLSFRSLFLSR